MVPVREPFDVVITSNSGYPLDLNLYQTMKGVSAANQVVRDGGAIIAASQCWDGIPEHGCFGKLLRESKSPAELLARVQSPGFSSPDQWQVQVQTMIQARADVYIRADGLTDEQVTQCLLKPCRKIEDTLAELASKAPGRRLSICVLPEGPITIPYVSNA
jgi:nickel-dependent lactate racemase